MFHKSPFADLELFVVMALITVMAFLSLPTPAHAASVSSTFTSTGDSTSLFVRNGEKFRLVITGTWVGTVAVKETRNGAASYATLQSLTANVNNDYDSKPYDRYILLTATGYTSGTVTYAFSNITTLKGPWKIPDVPIGQVAYASVGTSTTPVAGTQYRIDVYVPEDYAMISGIGVLNAATVGTNKWIVMLYDSTGRLVANSAVAGVLTAGANAPQEIPFTAAVALKHGMYIIAAMLDGTTDRFRTVAASTNIDKLTGSSTGSFGTVPANITPDTTFAADKGPVGYLYQ